MKRENVRVVVLGCHGPAAATFAADLGGKGYAARTASGESQVLEMARAGEVDLLLLDVRCAQVSGYQLLKHLRAGESGPRLPIVIYNTESATDRERECIEAGADEYLAQIVDPSLLDSRLRGLLDRKELEEKLRTCYDELKDLRKLSKDFTKVIVPIGRALSAQKDLELLVETILVEAKTVCNADAGTLYLCTEEDSLQFEIMHTDSLQIRMGGSSGLKIPFGPLHLRDPVTGAPNHNNVATHVALEGLSINIPDIYHAEGFDFSGTKAFDKKNSYRSTSSLTVPLKDNDSRVIGVLQLLNAKDPASGKVKPFDAYLQQIVELLSSQASMALSNQMLRQREKKLLKFENDVQIGRKIQTDFLPDRLPQPRGCEVVSCFRPAREVSGDFYDAFMLPGSRHMGLVIADVCDKGVPAALFMAVIRSLIRAFSERRTSLSLPILAEGRTPAANSVEHKLVTLYEDLNALNTVVTANNYIARTHSQLNMFATLFLAVLDPDSGLLTYVNGGHEAPIVVGRDGMEAQLGQTGPAVGMMPDAEFELQQHQMKDGDILFMYTDGVPETRDKNGAFFTEKRLFSLFEPGPASASALVKRVESALMQHIAGAEQFDDITMLAVRWSPASPGANQKG